MILCIPTAKSFIYYNTFSHATIHSKVLKHIANICIKICMEQYKIQISINKLLFYNSYMYIYK